MEKHCLKQTKGRKRELEMNGRKVIGLRIDYLASCRAFITKIFVTRVWFLILHTIKDCGKMFILVF